MYREVFNDKRNNIKESVLNNEHDSTLTDLYYDDVEMIKYQKERYVNALDKYIELFGEENVDIYSAREELK